MSILMIDKLLKELPNHVKLIAVSKTHSVESILAIYEFGIRCFAESKVQDLLVKKLVLPQDIEWHFIGHLQTNKVKQLLPLVSVIHSVDRLDLLDVIEKEAKKLNIRVQCLLQVHIAQEESKFGFSYKELMSFFTSRLFEKYAFIDFVGLMGMATFTEDEDLIRSEFRQLKKMFEEIKILFFSESALFKELSMGMSDDYFIAIEEGSTMLRLGSVIFGERNYINNK